MDRYQESQIQGYRALVRAYRGYIRGISNNNKSGIEVNKNQIKKLEARLDMSPKYFGESNEGGPSKAELYKLYTKAMKTPSGSPAHNELKDKIAQLRKELGMNESISKADVLEFMEDAMSGTIQMIENDDLVYSHKKALIESVDILAEKYEELSNDDTLIESIQLNEFVPLAALAAPVLGTVARAATGAAIRGGVRYLGSRAAQAAARQTARKVAQRATQTATRKRLSRIASVLEPDFGGGRSSADRPDAADGGTTIDPTAAAVDAGLTSSDIEKVRKGYRK